MKHLFMVAFALISFSAASADSGPGPCPKGPKGEKGAAGCPTCKECTDCVCKDCKTCPKGCDKKCSCSKDKKVCPVNGTTNMIGRKMKHFFFGGKK